MGVSSSLRQVYRSRLSMRRRSQIARARVRLRRPTASLRTLPDFLVIGTMRGGTSSLYQYLSAHPQVTGSLRKEVEYFSVHHARGEAWYRQHFALAVPGSNRSAFEATPNYLFHPHAPARAHALLPDARLVVLLREPVARARSHHQHMTGLGLETLGFAEAVETEEERIGRDLARMEADPAYDSRQAHRFSYVARGHYAAQLERWLQVYPREQLLIVESGDLYAAPAETFGTITTFLGLDPWLPASFGNHSLKGGTGSGARRETDPVVERLRERYAAEDDELARIWGRRPSWA